jgi:Flp pilus assembly protein TadD
MGKRLIGLLLLLLAGCGGDPLHPLLSTRLPSDSFARTALSDGAPGMALSVSANILNAHPDDEQAMLTQGDALAQLGRAPEAEAVFRRVIARDPASGAAFRGLGRLLLARDPAAAEAAFRQAIARDAHDAASSNDLGIALDLQGRHDDAQAAYHQALTASPAMIAATANLALSLSLSGHAAEAMQLISPLAMSANAAPRLRYDLAAVATLAGERQEAAAVLKDDLPADKLESALNGFAALSPAPPLSTPAPASEAAPAPTAEAAPAPASEAAPLPASEAAPAPAPAPAAATASVRPMAARDHGRSRGQHAGRALAAWMTTPSAATSRCHPGCRSSQRTIGRSAGKIVQAIPQSHKERSSAVGSGATIF